jgi:uncharacterized membrane protein
MRGNEEIERYLKEVEVRLKGIKPEERRAILDEIRAHLMERVFEMEKKSTPNGSPTVVASLPSPDEMAKEYLKVAEYENSRLAVDRRPSRILLCLAVISIGILLIWKGSCFFMEVRTNENGISAISVQSGLGTGFTLFGILFAIVGVIGASLTVADKGQKKLSKAHLIMGTSLLLFMIGITPSLYDSAAFLMINVLFGGSSLYGPGAIALMSFTPVLSFLYEPTTNLLVALLRMAGAIAYYTITLLGVLAPFWYVVNPERFPEKWKRFVG